MNILRSTKTKKPFARLVENFGSKGVMNHNIHISTAHRFVYLTNPKVACSSTKASLNLAVAERAGTPLSYKMMSEVHSRAHNVLQKPSQVGTAEFNAMMQASDVLRFSFVREPVARFCSAYLSKLDVSKRGSGMARRLWAHMGWDDAYPLSMEEFGELCASDTAVRDFDPHWKLQRTQIAYDIVDYGFLGNHASFAPDFAALSRRLFDGVEVPVFDTRVQFERYTAAKTASREISPSLRRNIETAYAVDFEMIEDIAKRGLDRL